MLRETLFISDLHLSRERPATVRCFLGFLKNRAAGVERLYILGDLFDAWIGDDDPTPPNREIIAGLRNVSETGTRIYFQPGNRDFLIGERFARESGAALLDDHALIDLYGAPTLLMHGDLLCTDDVHYLRARAKTHTPEWKQSALAKPLWLRQLLARWYRQRSQRHKRKAALDIMDVNQNAVTDTLRRYRAARLIHGHTHRPAVHHLTIDGHSAQRFVLAEWHDRGSVLGWDRHGYRIETFPLRTL